MLYRMGTVIARGRKDGTTSYLEPGTRWLSVRWFASTWF